MEWYVLRTTFTRREGAPVQFTKEKHVIMTITRHQRTTEANQ